MIFSSRGCKVVPVIRSKPPALSGQTQTEPFGQGIPLGIFNRGTRDNPTKPSAPRTASWLRKRGVFFERNVFFCKQKKTGKAKRAAFACVFKGRKAFKMTLNDTLAFLAYFNLT